jgi:hypothetical protein
MPKTSANTPKLGIANADLRHARTGEKATTMNSLAMMAGLAETTIIRLSINDQKAMSVMPLDIAGIIITVFDCDICDNLSISETVG